MKKSIKKLFLGILVVCLACFGLLFSACKTPDDNDGEETKFSLNYHLSELSLYETLQLVATGGGEVVWSSENPAIASVDGNGLVTAVGYGKTTVTAISGELSDSCIVTVLNEGLVPTLKTNVDGDSLSMLLNDEFTLSCSVYYNAAAFDDGAFTFQSSNSAVATVDGNGKITAVGYGETVITVSATWRNFDVVYLTKQIALSVTPNVSMSVSATETELDTVSGEIDGVTYDSQTKIAFSISLDGAERTDSVAYTWEYSKADIVEVDSDGNLTAKRKGEVDVVLACTVGNKVYRSLPIHFIISSPKKMMTEVLAYALDSEETLTIDGLDGMPVGIGVGDIDFTANATFSEGKVLLNSINHDFPCGETTLWVDTSMYSYEYTICFATIVIEDKEDFLSYMNSWSGYSNESSDDYAVLANDIDFKGENLAIKTGSDQFNGHFNGLGYAISNITLNPYQTADNAWTVSGVFGRIGASAMVENLAITGITTSSENVNLFAQYVLGNVQNIYLSGTNTAATAKPVMQLAWNAMLGGLPTIKNCIVNVTYTKATDAVAFKNADGTGAAKHLENCYVIGNAEKVSVWSDETRTVYADGYTFLTANKANLATWGGYWSLKGDTFYFGDTVVAMAGTRNDTLYTAAAEITLADLTDGVEIVSLTVNGASVQVPANGKFSLAEFVYGTANELLIITANGTAITQPFVTASHVISSAAEFMAYMNGWSGSVSATTNGTSDDYVVLTKDINLGGENVALKTQADYFAGKFNGLGHTITNMKYQPKSVNNAWTVAGIFGRVNKAGVIENVAFTGLTSSDGGNSALISDYMCGAVKNVYVQASVNNLKYVVRVAWGNNTWGTFSNSIVNINYTSTSGTLFDIDSTTKSNLSAVKNTYAFGNATAFSAWTEDTRTVYTDGASFLTTEKANITAANGFNEYWTFDKEGNLYFGKTKIA